MGGTARFSLCFLLWWIYLLGGEGAAMGLRCPHCWVLALGLLPVVMVMRMEPSFGETVAMGSVNKGYSMLLPSLPKMCTVCMGTSRLCCKQICSCRACAPWKLTLFCASLHHECRTFPWESKLLSFRSK